MAECPCCEGTGEVVDPAAVAAIRVAEAGPIALVHALAVAEHWGRD